MLLLCDCESTLDKESFESVAHVVGVHHGINAIFQAHNSTYKTIESDEVLLEKTSHCERYSWDITFTCRVGREHSVNRCWFGDGIDVGN